MNRPVYAQATLCQLKRIIKSGARIVGVKPMGDDLVKLLTLEPGQVYHPDQLHLAFPGTIYFLKNSNSLRTFIAANYEV